MPQGGDVILSPNPHRAPARRGPLPENLQNGQVIGEAIRAFIDYKKNEAKRRMDDVLKGIGAGIVNPDEALVQGTPGGADYETVFGVRPPEKPRYDPVEVTRSKVMPAEPVPEAGDIVAEPYVAYDKSTAYRKSGGFQPNDLNSLQRFVIRALTRNEPVSREMVAASGLLKTRAQEHIFDPQLEKDFRAIQGDRAMLDSFTKLRIAYPDAHDSDLITRVRSMFPSRFGEVDTSKLPDIGKSAREKAAEIKALTAKDIADSRNQTYTETWAKRLENARNLRNATIAATDRRTQVMKDRALAQDYRQLATHLSHDVGWENAFNIANEMIYGEGDMSNFEALRPVIQRSLGQRQRLMEAKIKNVEAQPGQRQAGIDQRNVRLNQIADALQLQIERMQNSGDKDEVNRIRSQIQALNNMGRVDPSRKQEAAEALARLLENEFGFMRDPDPQGVYERVMSWFTGEPSNRIVPSTPPSPDTQAKPAPKSNVTPTRPPKGPGGTTSDQFLERYRKSK